MKEPVIHVQYTPSIGLLSRGAF